jgi:hypothetical protein
MEKVKRPKTGGRAKGSRNKQTLRIEALLRLALKELGGQQYLVRIGKDYPPVFCSMVTKLIPNEIIASVDARVAVEVTDLEAARRIAFLLSKGVADGGEDLTALLPRLGEKDITPPTGSRMSNEEMQQLAQRHVPGRVTDPEDAMDQARVEDISRTLEHNRAERAKVSQEELLRPDQGLRPEPNRVLVGRRPPRDVH